VTNLGNFMINTELQQLLLQSYQGVLSTHSQYLQGYPFGSVVPFCLDYQGRVIILISELAQHTKNLKVDKRCSLLVLAEGNDIQAAARLTIVADAMPVAQHEVETISQRYYRYFPQSKDFHNIHDFSFWVLQPVKYRYIGGFGKIHWAEPQTLDNPFSAEVEADMIDHMNQDHADALPLYVKLANTAVTDTVQITMIAINSLGFHLRMGEKIIYIGFPQAVTSPLQVRQTLVELLKIARQIGN
jgi:heme iron utilization protein